MGSIYDQIDLNPPKKQRSGERVAIPVGNHGNKTTAALKIVKYLGERPTQADPELVQYGFLVGLESGADGTAFFNLKLKEAWLTPEAVALAFNLVSPSVEAGLTTGAKIAEAQKQFLEVAENRAIKNNTPETELEKATETGYDNQMTQIRINVGTLFRLQEWAGVGRSTTFNPAAFEGVKFAASVEPGFKGDTTEIKTVFSKAKAKAEATVVAEEVPY